MMALGWLNAWGAAWASFMVRALVDASVLLAVVALIWLPMRRKMSAQFAHGLFLLVLLKVAVPIPVSWPSWSAGESIRRAASVVSAWTAPESPAAAPIPAEDQGEGPIVAAWAPEPIVAAIAAPAAAPRIKPARPAVEPPPVRARLTVPAALMLAWAVVVAALLGRFARSVRATRRFFRASVSVPDGSGWFAVDFEALRRTAGVRSPVRWAVSQGMTSPAVGGLLRPTVVMPPDLDEGLSPQQLHWVLLHELAHIRRGDLWVVIVQRLVEAFFFFHPAVHVANWVIDQLREYACDDAALAAVHASRRSCGEGFLAIVCRAADRSASPAASLGLFESRMLIRRRLLRILDGRRTVHRRLSAPAAALLVGMALVVLPYGHGRPRDAAANVSRTVAGSSTSVSRPRPEEPRLFAPGATVLHDDRASTAGKPRLPVLAVAFAPDGRALATAGEDSTVVLRDPATGAARMRLEGHADVVTCLAFAPDGAILASGGYDRAVRLWDATTGRLRATLSGHDRWIFAVAFSPDGRTIASAGSDRTVRLWDVASGRTAGRLDGPTSAIRALAFSPDGTSLASAGADRVATVWSLRDRAATATLQGHRGTIRALAFGPDGRTIATAGEDGEVKLWDPKSGHERATLTGHSDMVLSLAFSPSGATLASGGLDASIRLWDPKTGRERAALVGHADGVPALGFAPDGRRLASAGHDGTVRLWEAAAPTLSAAFTLDYPGEPGGVAFAPDGRTLFAAGTAESLATYDPHGGLPIPPTIPGGLSLVLAPDGHTIALGGRDGTIRLVDSATRREVATWGTGAGEIRALAFGAAGAVLASGGPDGSTTLWDVASRSRIATRAGPGPAIAGPRISPDGRTLAVAANGRIDLIDTGPGEPRGSLEGAGAEVSAIAFSPDGRAIAAAGSEGVAMFDLASHARRTIRAQAKVRAVAFSPDGRFLVTGLADGEVGLWDVASGSRIATLKGHSAAVSGVAFDPSGRRIASAAGDRTIRLWDLDARRVTPRASLNGGLACIGPVAVSPDGATLAAAEVAHDSAGRIVLWDVAARRVRATLPGHDRGVASLAFAPDGPTLASSGFDRSVRLWDGLTGEARGEFVATEAAVRLAFSPDGKTLAGAGEDRTLTLWEVASGSELARVDGFRGVVRTLAFSPDGRRLATGGGRDGRNGAFGEVKLFDAQTLEERADLAGHSASVRSVAFAPDGATLATGGIDATVRLWDVASGRPRLVLGGFPDCVRALGVSSDGRTLAVAGRGDGVISLFDLAQGGEIARLVGHGGPVLGLTFLPDGRTLATGSLDASIKLWDVPANRAAIAGR